MQCTVQGIQYQNNCAGGRMGSRPAVVTTPEGTRHVNVESLRGSPETNPMDYANYTLMKHFKKVYNLSGADSD